MNDLKVTLIQAPLHWEDTEKNIEFFEYCLLSILPYQTDIIVLPEMFNTGFTMNASEVYSEMNSELVTWMKKTAETKNACITGSIIIREDNKYYNRLFWIQPDGLVYTYDKRHLFRMANEHSVFSPGNKKLIVNYKGWNICPLICYDLRFPVWSRITEQENYDLLIYVANWPEKRILQWKSLLIARAIENQSYVAGVNRTGVDGNGVEYNGLSMVIGPMGEIVRSTIPNETCIENIVLSYEHLSQFRKSFPAHLDADQFKIN